MGELINSHSKHKNQLKTMEKSNLSIAPFDAANEDDQAESVDSGCVPDLTPETSWSQISSALNYEYSFVSSLLLHTSQSKSKSSVSSVSENKTKVNSVSTSSKEENKIKLANKLKELKKDIGKKSSKKIEAKKAQLEAKKEQSEAKNAQSNNVENTSNTPDTSINVQQKKKLESELRKLKKGKIGALSKSQAKTRESKIKKQLSVMERQREKAKKKLKKESKAVGVVPSNAKASNEGTQKIYNSNGKLVFSKFDFSETVKDQWKEKSKPDVNYYMSKIIKEKERINSLTTQGKVDEAATYLEKKLWNTAMKKAQGEKVRDDTQRLKKATERKKQQKKKSATKWNDRVNTVKKFQEKAQEKKKQNVASRKQKQQQRSKGKKKKGKGTKRVPGF